MLPVHRYLTSTLDTNTPVANNRQTSSLEPGSLLERTTAPQTSCQLEDNSATNEWQRCLKIFREVEETSLLRDKDEICSSPLFNYSTADAASDLKIAYTNLIATDDDDDDDLLQASSGINDLDKKSSRNIATSNSCHRSLHLNHDLRISPPIRGVNSGQTTANSSIHSSAHSSAVSTPNPRQTNAREENFRGKSVNVDTLDEEEEEARQDGGIALLHSSTSRRYVSEAHQGAQGGNPQTIVIYTRQCCA